MSWNSHNLCGIIAMVENLRIGWGGSLMSFHSTSWASFLVTVLYTSLLSCVIASHSIAEECGHFSIASYIYLIIQLTTILGGWPFVVWWSNATDWNVQCIASWKKCYFSTNQTWVAACGGHRIWCAVSNRLFPVVFASTHSSYPFLWLLFVFLSTFLLSPSHSKSKPFPSLVAACIVISCFTPLMLLFYVATA